MLCAYECSGKLLKKLQLNSNSGSKCKSNSRQFISNTNKSNIGDDDDDDWAKFGEETCAINDKCGSLLFARHVCIIRLGPVQHTQCYLLRWAQKSPSFSTVFLYSLYCFSCFCFDSYTYAAYARSSHLSFYFGAEKTSFALVTAESIWRCGRRSVFHSLRSHFKAPVLTLLNTLL